MYEIFEKIDFNGGGSIDVDEFFTWLVCVQDDASNRRIEVHFRRIAPPGFAPDPCVILRPPAADGG